MVRRRRSPKHTMVPAPNLFKSIWILTEELNKSITDLLGHKLLSNQSSDWPSPINILWQSGLLHHSQTPHVASSCRVSSRSFFVAAYYQMEFFLSNLYSTKRITFNFFLNVIAFFPNFAYLRGPMCLCQEPTDWIRELEKAVGTDKRFGLAGAQTCDISYNTFIVPVDAGAYS